MTCIVCHAPTRGVLFCDPCGRSYDRDAHDVGGVAEAIEWAADRAARLRGATYRRGSTIAIHVTADEIVMLRDRVASGAEVSEEAGWDELLAKIERAAEAMR